MAHVSDADIAMTAREMVQQLGACAAVVAEAWADKRVRASDLQGAEACRRLVNEIEALLAVGSTGRLN